MVVMETTVVELFQHDAHTTPVAHLKPKTLIALLAFLAFAMNEFDRDGPRNGQPWLLSDLRPPGRL
jgi:hypothetical protein